MSPVMSATKKGMITAKIDGSDASLDAVVVGGNLTGSVITYLLGVGATELWCWRGPRHPMFYNCERFGGNLILPACIGEAQLHWGPADLSPSA